MWRFIGKFWCFVQIILITKLLSEKNRRRVCSTVPTYMDQRPHDLWCRCLHSLMKKLLRIHGSNFIIFKSLYRNNQFRVFPSPSFRTNRTHFYFKNFNTNLKSDLQLIPRPNKDEGDPTQLLNRDKCLLALCPLYVWIEQVAFVGVSETAWASMLVLLFSPCRWLSVPFAIVPCEALGLRCSGNLPPSTLYSGFTEPGI